MQENLNLIMDETEKNVVRITGSGNVEVQAKDLLKILGEMASMVIMYAAGCSRNPGEDESCLNMADLYMHRHFSIESGSVLDLLTDKGPLRWMDAGLIKRNNQLHS